MKVTAVEAIPLRARPAETYWGARTWSADSGADIGGYPTPARRRYVYSATIDTCLVRVESDDGVVGWGECKAPVAPEVAAELVEQLLAPIALGTELSDVTVTWERMYAGMRVRGHASGFWLEALAGVDIALWDAWARTLGQPLHALLGGAFRRAVPVYASGIPARPIVGAAADELRAEAEGLRDAGWPAVKVAIGVDPRSDLESVRIVRDAFGPDGQVFADAAGAYDVRQALAVGRGLAELGVGFFEMPIPPENVHGYRELAARLDIPLALDSLTGRAQALEFLRADALHILQPDVCRAGGVTEAMRIAALADAFGAQATPHVSIGSAVHFAASLQCAAALPNISIMEHWIGTNPLATVAPDLDTPSAGVRRVPGTPGLGVTVDEATVRTMRSRR
jgi:D-arabinonate dehydratase/D-galactarolactone cycloisomerase